jgi:NADH-quinone oxidoreductase subunit F
MCTNKPAHLTDEEILAATDAIVARCGRSPESAIPILQAIQTQFRHLPRVALEHVCRTTDIKPAQIAGISTFYSQFRHHGTGKHLIQVCHGTACHVAGAELVTDAIRRHLNLKDDQETTEDGLFTVERVGCVGCCSLAPVMLIDGVTFGHLDANKAVESVEQFLRDEAAGLHDQKREERRRQSQERKALGQPEVELRVGLNSCCIASGSMQVCEALEKAAAETGADVLVKPVGCTGMCHRVPLVEVVAPGGQSILYGDNNERRAIQIVRQNIQPKGLWRKIGRAVTTAIDLLVNDEAWHDINDHEVDPKHGPGGAFLDRQVRVVTDQCNQLDPLDIEEYIESGGYQALRECVTGMTPDEIIALVERSGMRGRGGAGFPTARKWRLTREAPGERRFVVCNGDEGDPGAFMDRMLLEAYPHRVIEGLAIAAHAVGAQEGYLYIRAEYAMAVQRVERAIAQAEERGLLGRGIFGSDFDLTLRVMRGGGRICVRRGNGPSCLHSGLAWNASVPPPYPAQKGLGDARQTSTTSRRMPACLGSSATVPRHLPRWEPSTARERRCLPWRVELRVGIDRGADGRHNLRHCVPHRGGRQRTGSGASVQSRSARGTVGGMCAGAYGAHAD